MTDTPASGLVQPCLTLAKLPTPVLACLAELLADLDRVALLHLALVAPPLFAPCLRVAIRMSRRMHFSRFSEERHRADQPLDAQVRLSPRLLGHFHATEIQPKCFHWSLILPLRAADRSLLLLPQPIASASSSIAASRRWSLLNVPLAQIRTFTLFEGAPFLVTPPLCRNLSVEGDVPWHDLAFPPTISSLSLEYITVRPECIAVLSQPFPNLRTLLFLDVAPDEGDENTCKSVNLLLANHIPPTVTTLILQSSSVQMPTDAVMPALAQVIPQLPSLVSLQLVGFDPVHVDAVMATLPRDGFPKLALSLNVFDEDHVAALERVAKSLPATVGSFNFDLMFGMGDYVVNSVRHFVARIPLAARNLSVRLPVWDGSLFQTIPFSPTLTSLKLTTGTRMDHCLGFDDLVNRLPTTLTHLTISSWMLHSTLTARSNLARRFPPRLIELKLIECELVDTNLVHFQWPSSLLHLDLRSNFLARLPLTLPCDLRTLVLSRNLALNDDGFHAAVLPTSLRMLDLAGTKVGDGAAAALLDRMPERSARRRMQVHIRRTAMSSTARKQLRAKFVVFE
ncbi:hypothetical protein GGF31_005577 [Allomyces arbusculus]|nr:hypothetical protein GGF31_005577 [Allomyces arbusculus]